MLLGLSLPADADALAGLPHPGKSTLNRAGEKRLAESVRQFGGLWHELIAGDAWEPEGGDPQQPMAYSGGFWAVLRPVGLYYGYSLYRYASVAGPESALALLEEARLEPLLDEDWAVGIVSATVVVEALQAARMLTALHRCAYNLFYAAEHDEGDRDQGDRSDRLDPDVLALRGLEAFHQGSEPCEEELLELAHGLLVYGLEFRARTVAGRAERRRDVPERAPWWLANVRELAMLSTRHTDMAKQHGKKMIESIFEERLRVLFQTLGFLVVGARPGEAASDLLCVCEERGYSFLVDAKSTSQPYKFPKSDRRAIADYVKETGSNLRGVPPIAFVLIVGPSISEGGVEQMRKLEFEIGTKVRFVDAALIATLQQSFAGPVPPVQFRDAVLGSDVIVKEAIIDRMKRFVDGMAEAYTDHIRRIRDIVR